MAGYRVVVVEDDVDAREYATVVLQGDGHDVIAFSNAVDAIDWLTGGNACDAVVAEVMLAGLSGIELCQVVQNAQPRIAVVTCTGHPEALEAALQRGFLPLVKPYSPQQLLTAVADAVSGRAKT